MPTADPSTADALPADARCDVLVVGGGINGGGIARDLAGRGLSVWLVEQDDLAAHTSSASTKLIHGGLRYLEHREFGLVRKALAEREVLLRAAPHLIRPLRFVMPHDPSMRPAWLIRAGLFLYDHLARREVLPGSRRIDLRRHAAGAPLDPRWRTAFVYSDGWVDDARLVVANAQDAAARGATVAVRTRCVEARRDAHGWRVRLEGERGATLVARALVNATGPWAERFLREHAGQVPDRSLRLVKGSHVVVPRRFEHDHAYLLQSPDGRIVFAIPYEGAFTLIGTTDVDFDGPLDAPRIDAAETEYLCAQANRYFARPVRPADVVWSYSGVRPLLDDESGDAAAVTRDYRLELDRAGAPLLTVWGGKLTTYRRLAEEAADALGAALGGTARGAWTAGAPLPGGDLSAWIGRPRRPDLDFARFVDELRRRHPALAPALAERLARAYGMQVEALLADGLGAEVAPGLHEAELRHWRAREWARTPEDALWRRSKLGLHYGAAERARVARWWAAHP